MQARYRGLGLIGPSSAKGAKSAGQKCARLRIDEELRNLACSQEGAVSLDDVQHRLWLTFDGEIPRPTERRATAFTRLEEGAPIFGHFGVGQVALDRARQQVLDENVALQRQRVTLWRSEFLKGAA